MFYVIIRFSTAFGAPFLHQLMMLHFTTPGRRQSKTLPTIDKCGSKIDRNNVFDCHLSLVWQQMAIENSVSNDFWSTFLDSIAVFDCRLPGVFTIQVEIATGFTVWQGWCSYQIQIDYLCSLWSYQFSWSSFFDICSLFLPPPPFTPKQQQQLMAPICV